MKRIVASFVLGLVAAQLGPSAIAGGTPEQKCAVAKLKAAGKKIATQMSCHAKAKAAAQAPNSTCLAKVENKFSSAITKAGDACPGSYAPLLSAVDDCVSDLLAQVPGDGKCPGASAKAAGKSGGALVGCQSKEVTKPGAFAACHPSVDNKLATGLAKAGACADATNVHASLHDCLASVDAIVEPPPTTTTTSSSTTTSTVPCQAVVGGFCWHVGAAGADCTSTCAAVAKVYDPATASYAGSGGSDANCTAVGTALSPGSASYPDQNDTGWGCAFLLGGIFRDIAPTTASATQASFARICACQ